MLLIGLSGFLFTFSQKFLHLHKVWFWRVLPCTTARHPEATERSVAGFWPVETRRIDRQDACPRGSGVGL